MIVGIRVWGVRRHPTGRTIARPTLDVSAAAKVLDVPPEVLGLGPGSELLGGAWGVEYVAETRPLLVGMGATPSEQTWEPGWTTARCRLGHRPPVGHGLPEDSGCGFHVIKPDLDGAAVSLQPTRLGDPRRGLGCRCLIMGLAGLAGWEVTEAELGYRGAEATVLGLLQPEPQPDPRPQRRAQCGCCWEPSPFSAVDDHQPADHIAQLADHYQVPVFPPGPELVAYAAKWTARPTTWQTQPIPPPAPPPPRPHLSWHIQAPAVFGSSPPGSNWLDPVPFAVYDPPVPLPDPGPSVPGQSQAQRVQQLIDAAGVPRPPPRRPPARRPPWWGQGGTPPPGTGPPQPRHAG